MRPNLTRHKVKVQRGFTLIEMMVAMSLAAVLLVIISDSVAPGLNFFGRVETDSRLKDLRAALIAAYSENAPAIDAVSTATFTLPTGAISPLSPNANMQCVGDGSTFAAIGKYLNTSATDIYHDGFGRSFCIYLTARQSLTINGVTFNYHSIAVVSPGVDGGIDATTALSATGVLTLGGDDKGILVDGRNLMQEKVNQSMAVINRAADAYQTYFNTRYLANATRDISVDYFAKTAKDGSVSSSFDANGVVPTSAGVGANMVTLGAHTALGLTAADVTDAYGQILLLDNSSDAVRNPENSNAALQLPGYTARISTTLPGGLTLARTVVGTY